MGTFQTSGPYQILQATQTIPSHGWNVSNNQGWGSCWQPDLASPGYSIGVVQPFWNNGGGVSYGDSTLMRLENVIGGQITTSLIIYSDGTFTSGISGGPNVTITGNGSSTSLPYNGEVAQAPDGTKILYADRNTDAFSGNTMYSVVGVSNNRYFTPPTGIIGNIDTIIAVSSTHAVVMYTTSWTSKGKTYGVWTPGYWDGTWWTFPATQIRQVALVTTDTYYSNAIPVFNGATSGNTLWLLYNAGIGVHAMSYNPTTKVWGTPFVVMAGVLLTKALHRPYPKLISGTYYTQMLCSGGTQALRLTWASGAATPTATLRTVSASGVPGSRYLQGMEYSSITGELIHIVYGPLGTTWETSSVNSAYNVVNAATTTYTTVTAIPTMVNKPNTNGWGYDSHILSSTQGETSESRTAFVEFGSTDTFVNYDYRHRSWVDWWNPPPPIDETAAVTITPVISLQILAGITSNRSVTISPALGVIPHGEIATSFSTTILYDCLTNNFQVDGAVTLTCNAVVSVHMEEYGKTGTLTVSPQPSVGVTGELFQIVEQWNGPNYVYHGMDVLDAVLVLVNANHRVPLGLPVFSAFTGSFLTSNALIDPLHVWASEQARTGIYGNDPSFQTGYQNAQARFDTSKARGMTSGYMMDPLNNVYDGLGASITSGRIVNSYTTKTATQIYNNMVAVGLGPSLLEYDYGVGKVDLYFSIGRAWGPNPISYPTKTYVEYCTIASYDYTGGPLGGGGGGGDPLPTEVSNTRYLTEAYAVIGEDWNREFLDEVNARRALFGLLPFVLPTKEVYAIHQDIASEHTRNEIALQIMEHESVLYPVGWQTVAERTYDRAGAKGGTENLVWSVVRFNYDPNNPASVSGHYLIVSDFTIMTPLEAVEWWWNSPGHRSNLLKDWGDNTQVYSYVGLNFGFGIDGYGAYQATYVTHNMLNLEEVMAERWLEETWQIAGALIEDLVETYSLTAYTKVRTQHHSGNWGIHVTGNQIVVYGSRIATQHLALFHYSLAAEHSALYEQMGGIRTPFGSEYDIKITDSVKKEMAAPYGARAQAENASPWTITFPLRVANMAGYNLSDNIRAVVNTAYDILTHNKVLSALKVFYSLVLGTTATVSDIATVTIGGTSIPIMDAIVSQDESSELWIAQIRITNIGSYIEINDEDPIILELGGETYSLLVVSRSIDRSSISDIEMTIRAASPAYLLGPPRATQRDIIITTARFAHELCTEIIGASVNWEIADWQIPANKVVFERTTPLEVVRIIAAAAGGVVQSDRDGSLTVRYLFPVTTSDYETASYDLLFTDVEDNTSSSESAEYSSNQNRFRIREGSAVFGDSMQWVPSEADVKQGVLRVYPSPWRDTFTVECTDNPDRTLFTFVGVQNEVVEEVVEFVEGSGSLRSPIAFLESSEWLSDDLGAVSYETYGRTLISGSVVNEGYGLLKVKYRSDFYVYNVYGVQDDSVQFIMKDTVI